MGYLEDSMENFNEKACYLEIHFEEWPMLAKLGDDELQSLYAALAAALDTVDCPAQGMKASGDRLRIVVQLSEGRTIDEILNALESASKSCLAGRNDYIEPETCIVESISPHNVVDAVVQLHRPPLD